MKLEYLVGEHLVQCATSPSPQGYNLWTDRSANLQRQCPGPKYCTVLHRPLRVIFNPEGTAAWTVDLGVSNMILLSNRRRTIIGLDGYGLNVIEQRPIEPTVEAVPSNKPAKAGKP